MLLAGRTITELVWPAREELPICSQYILSLKIHLLVALVVFAVCSQAQNIPYSQRDTPSRFATRTSGIVNVTGTIHSLDNKPLQDVKIELHDLSNGGMVDSVYTNASGTFEFPQVRSGSYEVVAISGLNETKERIEINSIPVMVNMRLPVTNKPTDGNNINVVSVAEYKVPEKARKEMRKAEVAYVGMGAALNAAKKFDEAIRTLERAQSLMPNAWQTYYEMGKSFLGKASYQEAVRQFDKAESLVPQEFALVHLARGSALVGLQQYPEALVELEIFLKKEPQGPNTAYAQKLMEQAKALSATALNK